MPKRAAAPKTFLTDDHKRVLGERVAQIERGIARGGVVVVPGRPFTAEDAERMADDYAESMMAVAHLWGWDAETDRAACRAEVAAYLAEIAPVEHRGPS